jgi:four helix bundle protein
MSIRRFEDLEIWKNAFRLAEAVYEISEKRPFARDYALKDQIRRAAISTITNIAEGFDRVTDREFIRFLVIARSSATEVQALLRLALSLEYVTTDEFEKLYDLCDHIKAGTTSLIRYLRQSAA